MTMDHAIQEAELIPKRASKQRLRHSIFEAWGHNCAYCGNYADTLDHVVPRLNGGLTVKYNLVPACKRCNGNKGHQPVWAWWTQQKYWSIPRALRVLAWVRRQASQNAEHSWAHLPPERLPSGNPNEHSPATNCQ